jgi:Ca-activated chloride channel family protein
MLRQFKTILTTALFIIGLITIVPTSQAEGWAENWKSKLGELWGETKEKAQKGWEAVAPKKPIEVGIAYGTEKKAWLKWAVAEFAKTEASKNITINLIPMGSIEGAEAVLKQDQRIQVWSPASSLVQPLLAEQWEAEKGNDPIYSDAPLVLTPMVMVMWEDRYNAFITKYREINFKNIASALTEKTGWAAIAEQPEWGLFTFGHTMPTHSNSGLLTLVLMAYDYMGISRNLTASQLMEESFLTWMKSTQESMSTDETSTGKLMTKMLRFGPAELNAIMVYENLALSNLEAAKGRWGKLKIIYPSRSVWNDNPYYILDVPWSTPEHKDAAKLFQDFLLSPKAQKVARDEYLFRPASIDLPILDQDSAFAKLTDVVEINVAAIQRPKAKVLKQLTQIWERNNK